MSVYVFLPDIIMCDRPNEYDATGHTPLYHAIRSGDLNRLRALLACPTTDPNKRVRRGRNENTPLMHAIYHRDNTKLVEALMAHPRIDPNKTSNRVTPLLGAVFDRNKRLIQLLLAHPRTDPNIPFGRRDKNNLTPFEVALESGNLEAARLIMADRRTMNPVYLRKVRKHVYRDGNNTHKLKLGTEAVGSNFLPLGLSGIPRDKRVFLAPETTANGISRVYDIDAIDQLLYRGQGQARLFIPFTARDVRYVRSSDTVGLSASAKSAKSTSAKSTSRSAKSAKSAKSTSRSTKKRRVT